MNAAGTIAENRRAAIAAALAALALLAGCRDNSPGEPPRGPATRSDAHGGLFESVAENLDHMEQFDTGQILKQTCDRLNQWYQQEKPQLAWQRDPLVESLSDELQAQAAANALDMVRFETPDDGWFLQEAVWLRDISNFARGDQFDDLEVARRLFDWTVRNIQLEDTTGAMPRWPYETLLFGRGTALDRAWVFTLLARQQGLDVVMLATADEDGKSVRPWLPALVLGDELYLFDCRLGLPIPGPTDGSVATLSQAAADEQILRRLDLDDAHPYPVRAEDLEHVVAFVEGSPPALSRRMALVESRLAGKQAMRLTSPGSRLAERVAKLPHVAEVRLWPQPFEVARQKPRLDRQQMADAFRDMYICKVMLPTLWRGRALHFKGEFEGEQGAKANYMSARPSDEQIDEYKLPDDMIKEIPLSRVAQFEADRILMLREGKQNASLWIGLIFFEQEDYPNAIDFLAKRTLGAPTGTVWAEAARYNLARAYEADDQWAKAVQLYEADTESPQSHGNRLRARWLKEKHAPAEAE